MKKIILLTMIIVLAGSVFGARWVIDPVSCPTTDATQFPGQSCQPDDICGDISGTAQCEDTSTITTPNVYNAGYQDQVSGTGHPAGYVLNCYASTTCVDKWSCQTDSTCNTAHVETRCEGVSNALCTNTCQTNWRDCNNDDGDNDPLTGDSTGDGCEVSIGSSCTVSAGLTGTRQSDCSCQLEKSYFETGTNTKYLTNRPLLWGSQYGTGYLMALLNYDSSGVLQDYFAINNSGCIVFPDGTTQCTAGGSGSGLWSSNPNGIHYNSGNVGIGTDNPTSDLHVQGSINVSESFNLPVKAPAQPKIGDMWLESP